MEKSVSDPAQFLASLLETGQELMRQSFASAAGGQPAGSPADPAAQWVEATKRVATLHGELSQYAPSARLPACQAASRISRTISRSNQTRQRMNGP